MLRVVFSAIRNIAPTVGLRSCPALNHTIPVRNFSLVQNVARSLNSGQGSVRIQALQQPSLLSVEPLTILQNRSVTKFSLKKGKRKTVRGVLKRFKRLHWGIWIRTRCGRHKKIWKKSKALQRRLRQHVFVNATQSWLLDKMVTKFWRRPKYYIDDPYKSYNKREEYFITRKSPTDY